MRIVYIDDKIDEDIEDQLFEYVGENYYNIELDVTNFDELYKIEEQNELLLFLVDWNLKVNIGNEIINADRIYWFLKHNYPFSSIIILSNNKPDANEGYNEFIYGKIISKKNFKIKDIITATKVLENVKSIVENVKTEGSTTILDKMENQIFSLLTDDKIDELIKLLREKNVIS